MKIVLKSPLSFCDARVVEMRFNIELAIAGVAAHLSGPMRLHALILTEIAGWFEDVPTNSEINNRIVARIEMATKEVLDKEVLTHEESRRLAQEVVIAVINCLDETTWDYAPPREMSIDDL